MTRGWPLLALLGGTLAASAATAGSFVPPSGCTAYLTVQSRGCVVSNHYICEADPPGHQWRADYDQEGLFFQSRIDAEGQWIESRDISPPEVTFLDPNPADPGSLTNLLSSGRDAFDFGLTTDSGARSRVTGYDRLTGVTVTIDGVTLRQTEFAFTETAEDGTVLRRSSGNEFVHPGWRIFLSGIGEWDFGDGTALPYDGSPVSFIEPGEPGFGATQPLFDCDAVLSSLPAQPQAIPPSEES